MLEAWKKWSRYMEKVVKKPGVRVWDPGTPQNWGFLGPSSRFSRGGGPKPPILGPKRGPKPPKSDSHARMILLWLSLFGGFRIWAFRVLFSINDRFSGSGCVFSIRTTRRLRIPTLRSPIVRIEKTQPEPEN